MSTTEQEAQAPQSELELDAPVTAPSTEPDGKEPKSADAADPSPAAKTDASDSPEPVVKGVQKRIDELTKNWRETERREREAARDAAYWREQALRQQQVQQAPQPILSPEKPKTLADFQFDESQYQQYLFSKSAESARTAAKEELKQEQARAERERLTAEYVVAVKEFAKEHPDYKEVAEYAPISEKVADIIIGAKAPQVAFYLGQNPDVAMQISRLPDSYAAYEIGQIAAKLKFEQDKVQSARSLVSSAPPPTPKLEGVSPQVQKDPKDMTQPEFNKWRRKQIAARKGWNGVE